MPKKKAEDDGVIRFSVDGASYEIDFNRLTWGESEEIEMYFDKPVEQINWQSARGVMFLAYLAVKRKRPSTELDYIRSLELTQIKDSAPERPTGPQPAITGSQS